MKGHCYLNPPMVIPVGEECFGEYWSWRPEVDSEDYSCSYNLLKPNEKCKDCAHFHVIRPMMQN